MKHNYKLLWTILRVSIAIVLLFNTIDITLAQTSLPAEKIAENALAATVYLEMKNINGKTLGIGSGFFVKPNTIVTNYHVIEGAAKGTAKLVGKNTTYNIEGVTATDKTNDLALLKVNAFGIIQLSLGDSDRVRIGETVYVAGNPKGLEGTFSDGIISSRRDKDTKERLQMTAPISPGSSGGPVLNKKGQVIGISFMTLERGQNLNFAIPSRYLKSLLTRSSTSRPIGQSHTSISAATYFLWGNVKYHMGNFQGAVSDYTKSISLSPNVHSYFNRGLAKYHLGLYSAAVVDYNKVLQRKNDSVRAYVNRGIAKRKLGLINDAISDYDTAILIRPDDFQAYFNRGLAKSALKQYTAAIEDFDKAIQLRIDSAEIYVGRGAAKMRTNKVHSAISDLDMAIQLKPDYAIAYFNRGLAKGFLGHHNEEKQDFKTALSLAEESGNVRLKAQIEEVIRLLE